MPKPARRTSNPLDVQRQHRAHKWRDLLNGFYFESEYSIPDEFQNGQIDGSSFDGFVIDSDPAEAPRLFGFGASRRRSPQALARALGYSDVRQLYRDMEVIGGCRQPQPDG